MLLGNNLLEIVNYNMFLELIKTIQIYEILKDILKIIINYFTFKSTWFH